MELANKFRLTTDTYGYKLEEHIQREYDDKNGHHVVDYWGNTIYPSSLANARKYLIERAERELLESDDYIEFSKAVDRMEQLKADVMKLSVED